MRIHVNLTSSKDVVFGALVPSFTEFLGEGKINHQSVLFFNTANHGMVYCNIIMAERIRERLRANKLSTKILDQAINSQPLIQ